jgi:hypothetical protein
MLSTFFGDDYLLIRNRVSQTVAAPALPWVVYQVSMIGRFPGLVLSEDG